MGALLVEPFLGSSSLYARLTDGFLGGLRLPENTFFLLAYNLIQCLQPMQKIYFKLLQPPPPPRQKIMVRP